MKNLSVLLMTVLSLTLVISCSSEDDDPVVIVEPTFLETYQGTVWHIAINDLNSEYLIVRDDESVPFEQWLLLSGAGCYEHVYYKLSDFDATIGENSEDYLEITFPSGHTWIIAVDGDILHWVDVSEEGIMDYIYEKQNPDVVNDLEMCGG